MSTGRRRKERPVARDHGCETPTHRPSPLSPSSTTAIGGWELCPPDEVAHGFERVDVVR